MMIQRRWMFALAAFTLTGTQLIAAPLQSPFELGSKKVHLPNTRLKKGTRLAVLLDEECWRKARPSDLNPGLRDTLRGLRLPESPAIHRSPIQTHAVSLPRALAVSELEQLARNNPCIRGIGQNLRASINEVGDDPMVPLQTHLDALGRLPEIAAGPSPIIAIIDTGIDPRHPDLRDHLWSNAPEAQGVAGVDDDRDGYVDDVMGYDFASQVGDPSHKSANDHGTHVAGLAAAVRGNGVGGAGVLGHRVQLMVLNVFGSSWGTETVAIDAAIRYAADAGAQVINISAGGLGTSDTTADAIVYAIAHGSTVVASVGNGAIDIDKDFYFPAGYAIDYPGLISVTATDASGSHALCDFSNFGPRSVKVAAPGCDSASPKGLLSTRAGDAYGRRKGTSMAAPLVAAAAAWTWAAIYKKTSRPPTPAQVEAALLGSAVADPSLQGKVGGNRRLDLQKLAEASVGF